jgi:YbgC/YbaW family acyl-CoA thioester hydrolase
MASTFQFSKRVEFSETDMAGIVHFSNFFRYMEMAEHAFIRSLGCSVHMEVDGDTYGWPRVHVECDFKKPLRYDDVVEIEVRVAEKKEKALHYDFTFRKDGEVVATGKTIAVCVACAPGGVMHSAPIPAILADQITAAESE